MSLKRYKKDPDAVIDFGTDWHAAVTDGGPWLATGEKITASSWFVEVTAADPLALLVVASNSHTDTTTTVWLTGGVAGVTYTLTNRITTDGGRTDDRSRLIQVLER